MYALHFYKLKQPKFSLITYEISSYLIKADKLRQVPITASLESVIMYVATYVFVNT